jgi:hypothetical protein
LARTDCGSLAYSERKSKHNHQSLAKKILEDKNFALLTHDSRGKISVSWQTVSRTYAKTYFSLAPVSPETPRTTLTLERPARVRHPQHGSVAPLRASRARCKPSAQTGLKRTRAVPVPPSNTTPKAEDEGQRSETQIQETPSEILGKCSRWGQPRESLVS